MKLRHYIAYAAALAAISCGSEVHKTGQVIPLPQEVTVEKGSVDLTRVCVKYDVPDEMASSLEQSLRLTTLAERIDPAARVTATARIDEAVEAPEGYRLEITREGVRIAASTETGLFYGFQTLAQLIDSDPTVAAQTIADAPRFPYRGSHIDVSRNFFGMDFMKKHLRMMSALKLNRLHWHLTDGAGWRIEIDRYPRLTQFAAWRPQQTWQEWRDGGCRYCEQSPEAHGGYFSKEEVCEIVAYARQLHITVIPEIEFPGHSEEVTAAYPELSCSGKPYTSGDVCIGNEKTFEFYQNVLLEVMELFPSEYIHIGGDEAGKEAWRKCPKCQARMRREGLKDVDELQSYGIKRMERFLNAHGRRMLGWDEILDGGLAPDATVMSWRGEEGGRKAAAAGHHVVMTPGSHCYFDAYQADPTTEPQAFSGYLPLEKVYSYDPAPADMEGREWVLGVQANLWSEFIPTPSQAEYMLYPRLYALAEVAWTDPAKKDYNEFFGRAVAFNNRAAARGYNVFDPETKGGERPQSLAPVDHIAVGCPVTYGGKGWSEQYAAGGDAALTDGLRGSWSYATRWQGFLNCDLVATVDLGKVTPVSSVHADFLQWDSAWIWLPAHVEIALSTDGKEFRTVAAPGHDYPLHAARPEYHTFAWEGSDEARYVRLTARPAEYNGGWLFTDEIIVR